MSSDHKHFGMNGNLSSSYSKKARELPRGSTKCWNMKIVTALFLLVIVGFGFTCVPTCLKDGMLGSYLRNGDSSHVLSENCNVSKEKVASSACCMESRRGVPSTENLILDLSENVAYSSSREDTRSSYLGSPSTGYMSTPAAPSLSISSANLCSKELDQLKVEEFSTNALEQCCESVSFRFAKICFWIFVGLLIGYNARMINFKSHQDENSQLMPHPSQQPQQLQFSSLSTGNWRKKVLIVFVLSGMIFSFWLFWYLNKDMMLRREETLANMCDERARMLTDQFNVSMNHVHSLAILVSTFHHGKETSAIDQKTFEDYTERTNFERPLTSGVAYALRVRHYEREQIEQQFGWTIKKMETDNQTMAQDYNPESFSNSPIQDEYAPVIFSQKSVSHIVSIDMMSGEEDRENILRARASGKGVLTSPFKLLKSNHLGVVLTFAVYNKELPPHATIEQRIDATVGYLGASYDVPSLVEKLLQQLASKQTILVNVYDITSKDAPIKMYGSDEIDTGLLHISYLDFGDPTRKHEMHCRFKQKPSQPWQAILFSGGVLVITFLLGYIFHAAINRIAEAERDFRHMKELMHRAEAADVAKSQFLATVSHEIRTPMNGVLGMLQMLMNTNLDASQLDYAQTAHASGTDLISLINQVLDQAKIESGRLELEDVPFDVRAVLDKVLAIFSGRTYEKGLEMAVYVSNQVPAVVIGDQERFAQIITNLVGNAIKFTHEKGHIFVSVHLADEAKIPFNIRDEVLKKSLIIKQDSSSDLYSSLSGFKVVDRWKSWENFQSLVETGEESGKVKLLITVEDTGAGIPEEAQGRMFTPFMQADSSTSRKYGGTGIGLSISKRSVNLMGGEIGFVSELEVGSTFSFTVTFTKTEADSLSTKLDSTALDIRGLKALVIDDKSVRAEVTRYHLGRLGVSAVISSSVGSACSNFPCISQTSVSEAEAFALVLIDHEIWTNDEWHPFIDLIKSTRQNSKQQNAPKIFLISARISPTDRNNLKSDGLLDDVITKPLRLNALASTFQEATGNRQNDTRNKQASLKTLLERKRILVVDDNIVNRRVAEGALKRYGAVVTCVEGGQYAVEFLKPPHKFDACFMDLQMPEIDGFEATRRIRNLEREYNERSDNSGENWHTPILAMTADVIQATNEKCMKSGMDDYVSKPFGEGQIYSAVSRFFENG